MKPALMIIDMQKEYYIGQSKESMTNASMFINEVIGYFRNKKLPIIWVQDLDNECGVIPGKESFEIIDLFKIIQDDYIIHKEYGNSFNKTNCGELLKDNVIDFIIMTGYCAENCVLSTYRGALDLDFTPVLLKNGIASGDIENLKYVEKISDTIDYNIVNKILENISI